MTALPPDPRSCPTLPFAPAAQREVVLFGAPALLVLAPDRARRQGVPDPGRPAFRSSPAPRILAAETLWRGDGLAVTPNRYPFAADQLILWDEAPTREHGTVLLTVLGAWVDRIGGTGLINTIGAAASIPRAHAHVTPERSRWLAGLSEAPADADFLPPIAGLRWLRKAVPFWLVGAAGDARARAAAVVALQENRATAACNLILQDGVTWLCPRSTVEIPGEAFPWAIGAAELWGRWVFVERAPWERAQTASLEQALLRAGMPAG